MAEASDASVAVVVQPLGVAYCTVSGFPYEYCEFHPDFKKCIAAAVANPTLHQYLPVIMNKREASMNLSLSLLFKSHILLVLFLPLSPLPVPPPASPQFPNPPPPPPTSATFCPGIESLLASLTLDAPALELASEGGAALGGEAAAAGASAKSGKKEKEKAVLIFESKKNKGKKATVVRGLDAFGVKLSDASKVIGCLQSGP